MGQCVHTNMVVCDVHTHGLFSHSGLVCVTRRLKEKLQCKNIVKVSKRIGSKITSITFKILNNMAPPY